jgi:phosphoribosylaminoimidazole-succinocarboxamide synthase
MRQNRRDPGASADLGDRSAAPIRFFFETPRELRYPAFIHWLPSAIRRGQPKLYREGGHRLRILDEAHFPELPNYYRGKVRDNYDLPDGRRIIISTDRLSAFDRILTCIPYKGQVLTQTARYWFDATRDICPNHVIEYPDPNVVVGKRLDILPVEIVVRGYLAGTTGTSILTLYKAGQRHMYGIELPDGLRDNQVLPTPIITPTSKAFDGGHDEPLTAQEIVEKGLLTQEQWDTLSRYALALFARGQELAADKGLILADTKYEFGTDESGNILLADEIHTPDSSRYWIADSYQASFEAGRRPASFDKDFVRAWVAERCDPYKDDIPEIPQDLIEETSKVYIRAFEAITGKTFVADDSGSSPKERVRTNLAAYGCGAGATPL